MRGIKRAMRKSITVLLMTLMILTTLPVNVVKTYAVETVDQGNSIEQKSKDNLQQDKEGDRPKVEKPQLIIKYKNLEIAETIIENANSDLAEKHSVKEPEKLDNRLSVKQEHEALKLAEITVGSNINITEVKEQLEKDPKVEYVQFNYQLESMDPSSEPDLDQQWALGGTGEQAEDQPYDLNIGDKWAIIDAMEPVTVGVIDTGIDVSHSELAGRIVNGWDFYNEDDSVFDEGDSFHGTQIAGIIGANHDGEGIAGLATKARIMPLKFIENGSGYTSDAIAAIEYARSKGISIINCSWGSPEYNQALKDAIEQNPNILFICAAGNTGDDSKIYPAAYQLPNIISVASMNQQGELAATSSYGSHVHIAAPGENIYSTSPGNSYTYGSGTSLAAAYATASAAIYKGLKPDATATGIALALKENASQADTLVNKIANGLLAITPLLENIDNEIIDNPEEDFAYLPQEVIELLNTKNKYSELNEDEKKLLYFHLKLTEPALLICEEAGLTLKQSIYKAKIMQSLNLTLEEAKAMGLVFASEKTAAEQAELLADYLLRFETLSKDKAIIIELIQKGYPARNIVNAYIASQALGLEISSIIAKDSSSDDLADYSSQEQQLIHALAISYNLNEEAIIKYMKTTGKTVQEIEELIQEKKEELNIYFEDELKALTTDEDAVEPYPSAPFGYRAGINETVNLNSGALLYEETLASMPGKNGLDLNLVLVYNSAETYSGNDQKAKWPQKYLGRGWSLNFTRILYRTDGKYIRLTDGSTYPLVYENQIYKLGGYKLSDIQVTVSSSKVTALTYADGRKESFDSDGNISSITDRFDNRITFSKKTIGDNKEVTIVDSAGQTTRILCNCELAANFYNIILPDKSVIALNLNTSGNLIKKEDQMGRVTTYAYQNANGTYDGQTRNYQNLIRVTYPTGLVCTNEYESVNGGIATYYRIKSMYKKDGKQIYLNDTYTYSASFLNATSDYSTTVTNALGTKSSYKFDYQTHLKKTETVSENNKTRKTIQYEYTTTELPKKITTQTYGSNSNMGKLVSQQYTYDSKGNVLTYTSPLASGYPNSEYEAKYSYDYSYNLVKSIEYKKDADTIIKQSNDLSSDRKAVRETRTTENGELKKKQSFEYDEFGNIISMKNYTGKDDFILTTFNFENGAYLKSTTTGGATSQYTYDSMGRVTGITDPNGNLSKKEYDRLGRITRIIFPDNSSRENTYNDSENSIIFKNENSNRIKYDYDGFGNIVQITDQTTNSILSSYKYDELLRNTEMTDGNGNKTEFTYDYADRLLTKTIAGSYVETCQYEDGYSLTLSREIRTVEGDKNAPTIQTFQDKDLQNNIVKSGFLNGSLEYATTYEYDYIGNRTSELSAKDREQGHAYTKKYQTDYTGNILSESSDKNIISKYQYDLAGRIISSTDPNGNICKYTYNEQNKLIKEEIPLSNNDYNIKQYEYDPKGNMSKQSISSGLPGGATEYRETQYIYNNRDLLTKVSSLDDGQEYYTEYSYDGVGNLSSMATGNGSNLTTYTYNSLNQLTRQTDPMGNSETYSYDLNNNLISKTDKNQNRIVNTYNALNQPVKCNVTQPDGTVQSQEISYALNGAKIKEQNENLITNLRYDNQGRVISQEDSNGIKQSYSYDLAGNRITYLLKQNGQTEINLSYSYDKQNRLTQVRENGTVRASYSYDPNGNCTAIQYDNGIESNIEYNKANLITQMANQTQSTTLSSYAYTYYLDGNQKSKTDHLNQVTSYEYDGLGRLKKEAEGNTETIYTYDQSSNRIKKNISGETPIEINYSYDANDRLIWEETQKDDDILASTEYYYDANGNQISKLYNDLREQAGAAAGLSLETQPNTLNYEYYEYDGFNRLTAYHNPTTTAEYSYNTQGLRVSKTVNGQTTQHIWDGSNMVMELDENNQLIDKYIRGKQLIKSELNGYYLHNGHGDVIQLADQQGNLTTSYLYDAFGIEQSAQPNDPNPFRYCGEYLDNESGNIYLRARYYDPGIGRFISEDSVKGQIDSPLTLNLYTYCINNPIRYIDPSGHRQIGDENLSQGAQKIIDQATSDYKAAAAKGDKKGMAAAHQKAEDARHSEGAYSLGNITMTPAMPLSGIKTSTTSGSSNMSSNTKGTTGCGISANINCGLTLGCSAQYVCDNRGNKGLAITAVPLTGGGTPSAGVSGIRSSTDAVSINELKGWTTNAGVSGTVMVGNVGKEINIGDEYNGYTTSVGVKASTPVEIHTSRSYTWVPLQW